MKLFIAFICLTVSSSQPIPERPVIPESFTSRTDVEFHDPRGTYFGDGMWDINYEGNMGVENYTLQEHDQIRRVERLQRYDMGVEYTINAYGRNQCTHREVIGHIPSVFGFLENATYIGTKPYRNHDYEFWGIDAGGFEVEVGVDEEDRTQPAVLIRRHAADDTIYYFREFNKTIPAASDFIIPSDCRETFSNVVQQL